MQMAAMSNTVTNRPTNVAIITHKVGNNKINWKFEAKPNVKPPGTLGPIGEKFCG